MLGSVLALRRERWANLVGFGGALVGGLCGIGAAVSALLSGPMEHGDAFALWQSPIPYVRLNVKLDPLAAFFVLIVSLLALALSVNTSVMASSSAL